MKLRLAFAAVAVSSSVWAQSAEEVAFAKDFLVDVQIRSIVENREYCGYFARTPTGEFVATKARRGKPFSCDLPSPPQRLKSFASYHTHAATTRDTYNEIPSSQDLRSDIESGLDGYIATPGGRLWFSDAKARSARQICGVGCLPQDPRFRPGKFMKVRRSYTLDDLDWIMGP